MNIRIERLEAGEWACRWICKIFSEKSCWEALPQSCKNKEWIEEFYGRIKDNEVFAYVGFVDGVPAGLFWAVPWESGLCSGHQFVLERYRGKTAYDMVEKATDAFFDEFKDATHLAGIIKKSNRKSVLCALKAGFKKCGEIQRYTDNEDCWIMMKIRPDR